MTTTDRREDEAVRAQIRADHDRSLLVEAAAGTGKTTVLVDRLVAILEQGRAEVGEIVAVTFSRKAAGELKLRLRQRLESALESAREREPTGAAEGAHANLVRAIAHLEEARIGTIHSFCAELLRERPVEAGVDPCFEEVAEDELERLFNRAFDRFIQERLDTLSPGLRRALNRLALSRSPGGDSPLERLRWAARQLAEWRDFPAAWERRPFDRDAEVDRLIGEVDRVAELALRGQSRDPLRRNLESAVFFLAGIRRAEQAAPAGSVRDYDAVEARLLELAVQLRRFFRKGYGKFAEALPREQLLRARTHLLGELDDFARSASADLAALLRTELMEVVAEYERLKRAAGRLDFLDLLLATRDLLRGSAAVRQELQGRFRYLFVDEFQDTDPLQAEILMLLAADDPDETDWLEVRPVAGKLFLVGDPKQSIYRFRRADVSLYETVKERLEARGVAVLYLSRSFRAVAPIQRALNRAFAEEMTGETQAGHSHYIPLGESRKGHPGQPTVIVLPPPYPYGWNRVTRTAVDQCLPETVGAFLTWLLNESGWTVENPEREGERVAIAPRHVCILFRRFLAWQPRDSTMGDTTRDYTRALEVRGVPHILVGARTFHQREEVETLRTALTAIEWPDDELSVYATLRGPLFAFADDLLLRYRSEHGHLHPFRTPGGELDDESGRLVAVIERLGRLHRRRNSRAMVETVQELLAYARAHAAFALRPAGHQVLGNVERVCDLARRFELGGGLSFRGFVERLNLEAERPGSGQAPVVEEGAEGVRIMTVHSAKGLEFPVVVLADITTGLARQNPERTVDPERRLCAMSLLGWSPWELLDHAEIEHRRDRAEGIRVAYVAATRARDLLVVPAVGDEAMEGWVAPLNKALYPTRETWRRAAPPAGCPDFGAATVLRRPVEYDGRPEGSVRPGRHHFDDGDYDVIWWDPSCLELEVEMNLGLGQEEVLAEDEGGEVAAEGVERYRSWRDEQRRIVREGSEPLRDVLVVSELEDPPPGDPPAVAYEPRAASGPSPGGVRYGTLVHTVLRDVPLDADPASIEEQARLQGRLLDATEEEVAAASAAVAEVLAHPLLVRAREVGARGGVVHREAEFLVPLDERRLVEGAIDLAFDEEEGWVVIDFKTDADRTDRRPAYERQVAWYLYALEQLTGKPGRGYLLAV